MSLQELSSFIRIFFTGSTSNRRIFGQCDGLIFATCRAGYIFVAADFDTADFADGSPGNLRVDYVLPSTGLTIENAGVFWPLSSDPLFDPVGNYPFPSSDHRLVWLDIDNLLGRRHHHHVKKHYRRFLNYDRKYW